MEQDKLKDLLHEKLTHTEVKPPPDMWVRLEKQLPDIRRELTFGERGDTPGTQDVLPVPQIRRPLRHKMKWAYVAASVAAIGVMIFTVRNLTELNVPVAEGGNADKVIEGIVLVDPFADVLEDAVPMAGEESGAAAGTIASVTFPRTTTTTAISVVETPTVHSGNGVTPGTGTKTPTTDTGKTENITPRADEGGQKQPVSQTSETQGTQDKTSDTKGRDGSAVWYQGNIADIAKRTRRTTPVALSLYASNATGTSGANTITGRTKLMQSSLIVTETTNYPGEDAATKDPIPFEGKLKHDLPLSFGASVNIGVFKRLSVETGLSYTYMRSKGVRIDDDAERVMTQKLHYLSIPVKLKYDFFESRVINLYAGAGFSFDKLLSGNVTAEDYYKGVKTTTQSEKIKVGSLQTSVGANLGLEFNVDKRFGLYIEPGVGYFFENNNQPESYRTENPFNFTIKAGFRIKL